MTKSEGLLIAIIVVLVFIVMRKRDGPESAKKSKSWDCVDRETGEVTAVNMKYSPHGPGCKCPQCHNPEKATMAEQIEHLAPGSATVDSGCGENTCDDKLTYAINDFGAPGMEFKDWVASQAVDEQIIKNHAEFVQDRTANNSQNVTGRTYSPGELDSEQLKWWGIRGRPQGVPYYNPTQVPDVDHSWYAKKPKLTWSTGV